MLNCPICQRITLAGESTGNLFTFKKLIKGRQIVSQIRCCINCAGTKLVEQPKGEKGC